MASNGEATGLRHRKAEAAPHNPSSGEPGPDAGKRGAALRAQGQRAGGPSYGILLLVGAWYALLVSAPRG